MAHPADKYRATPYKREPVDMTGQYNTPLNAKDEAAFRAWATANNRMRDLYNYDMRGAWKAGAGQSANGHFTDKFKKPNHPTFSTESQYHGRDGNMGGVWSGDKFRPSEQNIANMGVEGLNQYFARTEPNAQLDVPAGAMRSPRDQFANATQPWMRYQPRRDTLAAQRPTMAERIPIAVKAGLRNVGLNKFAANAFGSPIADLLGYSPVGAAAQAWDTGAAMRQRYDQNAPAIDQILGAGGGMALAALGAVPGGKALRGVARDAERGIVAYHGSPHTFDKFSLDKIGTGEGAQAYGHGLYFAENEGVARSYKDVLADKQYLVNGVPDFSVPKDSHYVNDPRQAAIISLARDGEYMARQIAAQQGDWGQQILSHLDALKGASIKESPAGSMYQVRINADPADFLDWDKPLAEQSDKVRAAIAGADRGVRGTAARLNDAPGSEFYRAVTGAETKRDAPGISMTLANAGIPGIKYLDAGSRGAGDGSRNFVVFNDKLIDILKRYGWVPGTAIPAGLMANAQLLTGEGTPGAQTQY